jgi:hypothetical protein
MFLHIKVAKMLMKLTLAYSNQIRLKRSRLYSEFIALRNKLKLTIGPKRLVYYINLQRAITNRSQWSQRVCYKRDQL